MLETSETLLERLRRPSERAAWARFVELYTPLLYSWARRAGLHDEDAGDLVQDVFALLLQKLPDFTYDGRHSFRAWLRTVTMNHWRNRLKSQRRQPSGGAVELDGLSTPDGLEEFWDRDYHEHLVARALTVMQNEFELTTWRACWESVVAGRAAADVAAELGVSENAVYIAKYRVLRRLRQELAGLME